MSGRLTNDPPCDRCGLFWPSPGPQSTVPGSVEVRIQRDDKYFITKWCPTCAVVLWDQLADLSTFHEMKVMHSYDEFLKLITIRVFR